MSVFDEINDLSAEQVLSRINLPQAKVSGTYICPECQNGTGATGDGIRPRDSKGRVRWKCHKCGKDFSNFDLAAATLGLDSERDKAESARRVGKLFGLTDDDSFSLSRDKSARMTNMANMGDCPKLDSPRKSARKAFDDKELKVMSDKKLVSEAEPKNYAKLYKYCRDNVAKFLAEQGGSYRGLTAATFEKYGLGVHPDFGVEGHEKRPHLIIPYDDTHFMARAIVGHDRSQHGANSGLYEPCKLSKYNFVVEGEIDALSIAQAVQSDLIGVVATGGAAKYQKVVPELEKRFGKSDDKPSFIVTFDNDAAGKTNGLKLVDELMAVGFPAVLFSFEERLAGDYEIHKSDGTIEKITASKVDANDLLVQGNLASVIFNHFELLKEKLDAAKEKIQATLERQKLVDEQKLQAALLESGFESTNFAEYFARAYYDDAARADKYSERKTGFDNLDAAQIFMPGVYVLGALPATGKTTFAWQLLEQLARRGEFCFYVTYEQSRFELYRKSISREMFKRNFAIGKEQLAKKFASELSLNLRVLSLSSNVGVDALIEKLKPMIDAANQPPVICMDYLQIIPPSKGLTGKTTSTKERVDDSVRRLKDFQRETDATLIVISSFNRENYYQSASFLAFKETGGIEFTADVVWALQNGGSDDEADRATVTKIGKQNVRTIRLSCLKNRNGGLYDCYFRYRAAHDCFEPLALEEDKRERPTHER